jgi:hypothetical protein
MVRGKLVDRGQQEPVVTDAIAKAAIDVVSPSNSMHGASLEMQGVDVPPAGFAAKHRQLTSVPLAARVR